MNTNLHQITPQPPQNEMPFWLRALFIIGGTILLYHLLSRLFDNLFPPDKETKVRPRVFISHSWANNSDYSNLIKKFDNYGFEFYNHSIEENNPVDATTAKEIEKRIENKIRGCSKVLVLGGKYANRYWIKKEVEIANRMGKEVIAIRPWGESNVPSSLYKNADKVLGFNSKTIIENLKD